MRMDWIKALIPLIAVAVYLLSHLLSNRPEVVLHRRTVAQQSTAGGAKRHHV